MELQKKYIVGDLFEYFAIAGDVIVIIYLENFESKFIYGHLCMRIDPLLSSDRVRLICF